MNNPRPLMSIRKTVQLMVILTILAWATQTLFAQWGLGGLILPERTRSTTPPAAPASTSSFGPAPAPAPLPIGRSTGGAAIELQPHAHFPGEGKITLRDVCKWSDADAAVMEPLADTLIAHIGNAPRVRHVTVDNIKSRLHDAGANLSSLHFTGSARCAILIGKETEADIAMEGDLPAPVAVVADAAPTTQPQQPAEEPAIYEEQLVLTRPLSRNQRLIASDIAVKRVQVDAPTTRPSISKDDIIGNVAARDLKPGEVFDADDIKRPAIVTKGQFLTVAMRIGRFDIETVARAMDAAAMGEMVRAKNEANGEVYHVVITGANEGRVEKENDSDVAAINPQH